MTTIRIILVLLFLSTACWGQDDPYRMDSKKVTKKTYKIRSKKKIQRNYESKYEEYFEYDGKTLKKVRRYKGNYRPTYRRYD